MLCLVLIFTLLICVEFGLTLVFRIVGEKLVDDVEPLLNHRVVGHLTIIEDDFRDLYALRDKLAFVISRLAGAG